MGSQDKRETAGGPTTFPKSERDYYLERRVPELRQPGAARRGLARGQGSLRRRARRGARAVTESISTSATPIERLGLDQIREKYGNLFEIYERITGEDAYQTPMRIYPAVHYTMGGLWVDYDLMSNIPGLFVAGEANFSDQGANRLGASALMQGPGRRLLHLALHAAQLPGHDQTRKGRYLAAARSGEAEGEVQARIDALA